MSFTKLLKNENSKAVEAKLEDVIVESKVKIDEAKKPEDVLRGAGFKIKLITPTSFGTQIDFAKKYDSDEVKKALVGFNIKLKDKSVFIVD